MFSRQPMKNSVYRSRQSLNSPSPGETEMDLLVTRERPRRGIRNSGYDVSLSAICSEICSAKSQLTPKTRKLLISYKPECHWVFNVTVLHVQSASWKKLIHVVYSCTSFYSLKWKENICPETHYLPKCWILNLDSSSKYVATFLILSFFSLNWNPLFVLYPWCCSLDLEERTTNFWEFHLSPDVSVLWKSPRKRYCPLTTSELGEFCVGKCQNQPKEMLVYGPRNSRSQHKADELSCAVWTYTGRKLTLRAPRMRITIAPTLE